MKLSDHLALINKIEYKIKPLSSVREIDKDLIDDMIAFIEVDNSDINSQLIEKKDIYFNKLYQTGIHNLNKALELKKDIIKDFSSSSLIYRELKGEYIKLDDIYEEIEPISFKKRTDKSKNMVFENPNEKNRRDFIRETVNKQYEVLKKKLNQAVRERDEKSRKLQYLLSFKIKILNESIAELDKITTELINIDTDAKFFKDEKYVRLMHKLMIDLKLIEEIDIFRFLFSINFTSDFELKSQKGRMKYICYIINKFEDFIYPEKYEEWKNCMIENFNLRNYDKVNNPSQENKSELHIKIDNIIETESY